MSKLWSVVFYSFMAAYPKYETKLDFWAAKENHGNKDFFCVSNQAANPLTEAEIGHE